MKYRVIVLPRAARDLDKADRGRFSEWDLEAFLANLQWQRIETGSRVG